MKKVAIIGGGASGIYLARALKGSSYSLTIFEKREQLGKKLMATGNGRCNCLNKNLNPNKFSSPSLAKDLFSEFPYMRLKKTFEDDWHIPLIELGDFVYPSSLSAIAMGNYLKASLDARILCESKVADYQKKEDGYHLYFDGKEEVFDILVIATGGKSAPKFGSDGSFFSLLERHGYEVTPLKPGLTPILVQEKNGLKSISGVRIKAEVEVREKEKTYFQEEGEVLFRKDGLSGIVIFDAESVIVTHGLKNAQILIHPLPGFKKDRVEYLTIWKREAPGHYLEALFVPQLASYLLNRSREDSLPLSSLLTTIPFTYENHLSFDESTVTLGGISLNDVTDTFESKKEKSLYFLGEILDFDGLCGGYNLSFCLASALKVAKDLRTKEEKMLS